jgi:N-acetylglutamate synthase-like GNAT family acetyltransferase
MMEPGKIILRPACNSDAKAIKDLIYKVGINPMDLNWRHFIVAVDAENGLVGCGQIKPHGDGSRELASIAVRESDRGRGVARAIIERLLAENPPPLYLTCRSELESLYQRFRFRTIAFDEMPPYFRRISRLARVFTTLSNGQMRLLVMKLDG